MPPRRSDPGGTEDHRLPARPAGPAAQPALVVAFPRPAALPLPQSRAPVGREWLAEHGVFDKEVSGAHLLFSRPGGELFVEDAGSRNGTWLDGRRLTPGERVPLADGAILRIGRTLLVHRDELEGDLAPAPPLGELVGPYGLRAVATTLAALRASPPRNVLIEGETGTGKELAALAVAQSLGRARPYAAVNVAGVAPSVFESQLFGHVPGAFSGADRRARGVIAAHAGGAVFLDEIGELSLELQPKLLRLLENREILPVGAERPEIVDVLLIAATNRPLEEMVTAGRFRRDLHARLAIARVELPPLRERVEDLLAIAQALVGRSGAALSPEAVEVEALERLLLEAWPSNVRGLWATLERARALDPAPGLRLWAIERVVGPLPGPRAGHLTLEAAREALAACDGNETQAAKRLGVSRGKLRRFLALHGPR